jgi:thymidylate synthase ThyX
VVVFAVSGVSRTCTHQLVRTRKAAFHQSSQRASYLGDRPEMRIPESVWNSNNNVRVAWEAAILAAHKAYQLACEADIAYQDARFILPEGTDNFIVLEYPLREFINVYSYRACYMFQWEISHVMRECRRVLLESIKEPAVRAAIYDALKISCQKTGPAAVSTGEIDPETQSPVMKLVPHHCTFQGWESPEGHCPFEWALDEARTFKPKHHRI